MKEMSRKITNWLVVKGVISYDEREIYEYGVFQMIMNTIDTISILILAILFHKVLVVFCYIICFCILRKYAGGYHAKSVLGCYVLTVSGALMMLLVVCFCNIPLEIMLVVWGIAGIIIVLFAPVQNRNKILDEVEHLVYRRRAIIIWILESMLMWLLYSLDFQEVVKGILVSNIIICISMNVELIDGIIKRIWFDRLDY